MEFAGLIVTTGTDLSAGRQVGLWGSISATLLQAATNVNKVFPNLGEVPILVILAVMVVGGIIGAFNGAVVAFLNLHPFIVTMGL